MMSGIAGIIYPDAFHVHLYLDPMLHAMANRSPDPSKRDSHTHKNVRIGIIGGNIAYNAKRSITCVLDGNIYNHNEVSQKLQKEGYNFSNLTPAKLLVHAYENWKEEFPKHIDGDFAAAIYDNQEKSLFLVRDRLGCKPLYWYKDRHYFLFASEMKALLATGLVPRTPDTTSLAAYLCMGYTPLDMTPIQNVNKLLPANYLCFSREKGVIIKPYWSLSDQFQKKISGTVEEVSAQMDELLQCAVACRIPSEKNIGCYLSGGIGSASIASYLRANLPQTTIPSYTVYFENENIDDLEAAMSFTNVLSMEHHVSAITPATFLQDFVKMVWHLDEPIADPNIIATWNLAKLASQSSQVAFSGMGSDEFLAGHSRYTIEERAPLAIRILETVWHKYLRIFIAPVLRYLNPPAAFRLLKHTQSNILQISYLKHNSLFNESQLATAAPSLVQLFDYDLFLNKFHKIETIPSLVSSLLYLDAKTRLPDRYITQFERLNSSHGLDWRAPFFATKIIEYLAGYHEPENLEEKETALLLKLAMRDRLPEEALLRPKKTRPEFLSSWCSSSQLMDVFQMLPEGALVESGIVSKKWLIKNTEDIQLCQEAFSHLWAILSLEVWYRLFIHYPITSSAQNLSLEELLAPK